MHEAMAATLDTVIVEIKQIQLEARDQERHLSTALAHDCA